MNGLRNFALLVLLVAMITLFGWHGNVAAAAVVQASFDCAKASTPIETIICSDETLAILDRELGLLFTNARTALDGETERLAHLKEQRAWLKSRLTTCEIPRSGKLAGDVSAMRECLIKEMRKRNELLTESLKKAAPEIKAEAAPFDSVVAAKTEKLKISRITPKGDDVDKREQIVFQFNRPVVPIGKMDRDAGDIPIEIIPHAKCQWRWLNRSALACNLDKEDYLFLASHYKVNVKQGIMDENGATIGAPVQHEFITARPRVLSSQPYKRPYVKDDRRISGWDGPGIPVIDVRFNQQVTMSSVSQSLHIEAKGERYALEVSQPDYSVKVGEVVWVSLDKRNFWVNTSSQMRNDEPVQVRDHTESARLNWVVKPQKALPEDTEYVLKVEPGLVSAFGPLRSIENRIITKGKTFPAFSFLGFKCKKNDDQSVFISAGNTKEKCSVFENVGLIFSSPVHDSKQFATPTFISPPLMYSSSGLDPLKEISTVCYYCEETDDGIFLPKTLKNSTTYAIKLKGGSPGNDNSEECIKDVFDRCLPKDVSASFVMDRYRPTFNWSGQSSVLEKDMPSDVSLYSANLERATLEGETFTAQGGIAPMSQEIPLLATLDRFERSSFGVKKLLANGSGIVSGQIKLQPETAHLEGRKDFFAQVTPFHVHAKVGEDSGLVWVTDLTTGKPVEGAEITVFEGSLFGKDEKTKKRDLATSRTNNKGVASIPGYNALTKNSTETYPSILVSKGQDLAYLPLHSYEFSSYHKGSTSRTTRIATWGMTAEGVYRPGKEVDYKLYVRDMYTEGARLPEIRKYQLEIHDPKGAVVEKKDITLSEFGTYADKYPTGLNGASGRFEIFLRSEKQNIVLHAMDFLVTDYVPASFKVQTTLNQQVYKYEETVVVDTTATLHSGGPFTDATNRYFATLYGKPFRSTYPATEEFWFGSPWCRPLYGCPKYSLMNKEDRLDQEGKANTSFAADGREIGFGTLEVESAVEDDRGKKIANMAKAEYFGVDRFVGIKTEIFDFTAGKPAKFRFVVTDGKGIPVEGINVNIESSGQRYMAYVAKGAGNSYVTHAHTEQAAAGGSLQLLSGKTAEDFEMVFNSVGKHFLTATIEDSKGRSHTTEMEMWVTGPDAISWGQNKDDALDFVTKKTSYTVGETATILVKNPYPKAKALVTVERMGIVKSWVETLDSSLASISFIVTEDMAPNFALSVVVFSPRVDTKQVDNSFDLGKPEWRMGYVQMEAKGKKHKFDFKIDTDMDTYRPGQEVHAKVQVTPRDGVATGRKELTIAVLDEAVFDLIKGGMTYFDPQKGFYGTLIDSVQNYNILRKLVTHAPATPTMKGDDPGGDGAMADRMRSDLKSLAYWNPAIITDATGKAEFTFKAPDNLTGWRILVLATDQNDYLDVGYKNIKVNRLTEIQPAMPNQVVEGDSFVAAFSVMNRTPDKRKIKINISALGTLTDSAAKTVEEVEVGPFERKVAKIRLTAGKIPMDRTIESGQITLSVQAGDALDKDALTHQLVVNKKKNLDVGANYGTTSEAQVQEPLLFPENIRTDMGDVTLTLSPTLIGDLEGAFRFMKSYPYTCWEQKLSRAVMAANYQALKKYLSPDLTWDGSNGTIVEAIDSAKDFQAPNGGMGFFKKDNDRVDPYLSAYTALCFTMLEGLGYKTPKTVEEKLHGYLLELLRTDVMPSYYSKGMASSVRAVALGALSRAKKIDTDMLKRHMEHLDQIDMFGKSQMLEAAIRLGNQEAIVETIADKILGSSNETGGRVTFNESLDDGYNRILSSTPRTNCAVLSSLLLLGDSKKGAEQLQDLPYRLARTIRTMRGQKDHFENTQENLFCTNSLVDYSRRYEKVEPNMEVAVSYAGESLGNTRFASFQDKPLVVSHAINASDPGKRKVVVVDKKGEGRIYYATVMHYAPLADQEKSVNAGMQITREYFVEDRSSGTWRLLGREDKIKRGDVVRVDLYLHLPAARTQIVVDDPIPGALEPVNTELATASQVDADKAKASYAGGSLWFQFRDWNEYNFSFWSFNHRELRHDAARFYAEYLPPGNYHLAYTAQAVAEGDFVTQPVFAGEMYDADIYGKGVSGSLHVDP